MVLQREQLVATIFIRMTTRESGAKIDVQLGAVDSPLSPRHKMSWIKKLKKSRRSSQQPSSLGIPSHIGLTPLGIGAELNLGAGLEGASR